MRRLTRPGRPDRLVAWLCLGVLLLAALPAGTALAEALAAPLAGPAATPAASPGLWDRALAWIFTEQRAWHRDLVAQLRALGQAPDGSGATAWALIGASFLYGLFHAAGPGHGKVVLTSYLLTHRQQVRRGIGLAAASAFCQGIVAVVLVYGLLHLTDLLPRDTRLAIDWTGRASFALLIVLGLWLALRALRDGARLLVPAPVALTHAGPEYEHRHEHGHGHADACGHSHGPDATQLAAAGNLRGALAVVLSIGLRPCSGAVLVLVLALALDLPLAGLAAVLAMSAGTAIAVAALALLTVHARNWAARLAGGGAPGRRAAIAGAAVRLAGGLVILALGGSLLAASFGPVHPLGM